MNWFLLTQPLLLLFSLDHWQHCITVLCIALQFVYKIRKWDPIMTVVMEMHFKAGVKRWTDQITGPLTLWMISLSLRPLTLTCVCLFAQGLLHLRCLPVYFCTLKGLFLYVCVNKKQWALLCSYLRNSLRLHGATVMAKSQWCKHCFHVTTKGRQWTYLQFGLSSAADCWRDERTPAATCICTAFLVFNSPQLTVSIVTGWEELKTENDIQDILSLSRCHEADEVLAVRSAQWQPEHVVPPDAMATSGTGCHLELISHNF